MSDGSAICGADDARMLAQRALRAIVDAQARESQSQSARTHLATAVLRAEQLRTNYVALWEELQRRVEVVALGEREAGRPPEHMLIVLKGLVDDSGLDHALRRQIEPDVVRWGISAYFTA